ncbi:MULTISPECIES: tetratricopeptide repeat protein [Planktothrix]|uniref:tetratricopeptide repeat protein n=1 Tax=Planktothrix TaxID=54304 RepID=UPI00040EBCC7|nr:MULTISPECIES: tetratricopeptide repeat protein [Planktothrix]
MIEPQPKSLSTPSRIRIRAESTTNAHYRLAKALSYQGDWLGAIAAYQNALQLEPHRGEFYQELGDALSKVEKWEDAIEAYQQAIQCNPDFSWSHNNLGDALRSLERWSEAVIMYSRAIELNPDFALSYHNLGDVFGKLEQWEESVAAYQHAIELDPNFVWSYYNLAEGLVQLKQWDKALVAYRQAQQLQANLPEMDTKLKSTLHQHIKQCLQLALLYYRQAIEQNPNDIESYEKALELQPDDVMLYVGLGDAWVARHQPQRAITAYQQAITLNPSLLTAYQKLAELQYQMEKPELALMTQWQSLEHSLENKAEEYLSLGEECLKQNYPELAIRCYQQAIKRYPNCVEAYLQLGELFCQQQQLKEAISLYQTALLTLPNQTELYKCLGDALAQKHQWQEAVTYYQQMVEIQGDKTRQLAMIQECGLIIPRSDQPTVSVIIPVYNKIDYTFQCLRSLAAHVQPQTALEVIVVNDASTDRTQEILANIEGLILIKNPENLGFIQSCNQGAAIAQGEYLYFLNNDTEIRPNAIEYLIEVLVTDSQVGAVGSKLIYPSGALQESGGIIWNTGEGWNYGRNENPYNPKYNYLRPVDYCSGASLMVRCKIFQALGGFEREFSPAYYEDTDLCFAIREWLGLKVMVQPKSEVIHYEGISSGTTLNEGIKQYQLINQEKFKKKWHQSLIQYPINQGSEFFERASRRYLGQAVILVIDSYMPCHDRESGSRRLFYIMKLLKELNYHVIFAADNGFKAEPYTSELENLGIEVLYTQSGYGYPIEAQIQERIDLINLAWVCRPELNEKYKYLLQNNTKIKIIYDTIDLHYLRMKRAWELSSTKDVQQAKAWINMQAMELKLAMEADLTVTVTATEKEILQEQGVSNVAVIPNIHPLIFQKKNSFSEREGILFIGSYNHDPNVDAVLWLCQEIMPLVWRKNPNIPVTILGNEPSDIVQNLANEWVTVTGYVQDVSPYFLSHRLFVAPLRYGAGMKGKIGQSLEYGLPVVSTSIGIEGMNLVNEQNVLVADTIETLAEQILRLYQEQALWEKLVANTEQAIAPYCPEFVKLKLAHLIQKITS